MDRCGCRIICGMRYSYGVQAQPEWLSMFACRGAGAIASWNYLILE